MRKHLLIVDEEPAILDILRLTFELPGYQVTTVNNGFAALSALVEPRLPDVVIIGDLYPRPETSLGLVNDIRVAFGTQRMPMVMLSTQVTKADVTCGLAFGADRYCAKPFSPSRLLVIVDELIHTRAA